MSKKLLAWMLVLMMVIGCAGAGAEELSYYERTPSGIPVFAVAAYSGTGKTTFFTLPNVCLSLQAGHTSPHS